MSSRFSFAQTIVVAKDTDRGFQALAQSAAHANATWTGGAVTSVSGGEGMFGSYGVDYTYGPTLCTDTVKGETAGCLG